MHQYATISDISVRVKKGRSVWRDSNTCRIIVSVGRPNHEEDKLTATIQWVNKNYKNCIFTLCDVLHRYNYITAGFSPTKAYITSKNDGDLWIERNKIAIESLTIPSKIIRWEYCLNHENFPSLLEKVTLLYEKNTQLQAAINSDINRFINTQKKNRVVSFDKEQQMRKNGKDLLLEEIAGCSILIDETETIDVYPGSELKAIKLFRDKGFSSDIPGLAKRKFTQIDFGYLKSELTQAA